ncbi:MULTISPECIES: hypothetical protein [Dyella]|uniref:Uncharacterized protein n=2 Tax=Dyella TaxID=231454 RepID=A0A4R0YY49_9GAMM|nr:MULTISPECIES: hypothetical protein [Dyella]TBR40183.1 hypothetical protein EYV96_08450 [Dyella terrae]TCI12234.1 hypothetical protein EZM97_02420 [Dyella soli]
MRHRVIAMLIVGIAAAAITLPVRSQSTTPPAGDASLRAVPGGRVSAYPEQPQAAKDPDCLKPTGSAVQTQGGHCMPVNGKTYTKEQLDRTGEKNLGPALQKLDPSITTRGR